MSQRELAAAVGVARKTISNAERGAHRPWELTARAIAAVLGVADPDELFPER